MHTVTANSHNKYTSTGRGKDSGTLLCFAITLTNHSVQTQIHFTNARPQFQPDWVSSGACSVHNAYVYMQNYIYRYSMACDVKCTYATQTLHVRYVQFSGKAGDGVQL